MNGEKVFQSGCEREDGPEGVGLGTVFFTVFSSTWDV